MEIYKNATKLERQPLPSRPPVEILRGEAVFATVLNLFLTRYLVTKGGILF